MIIRLNVAERDKLLKITGMLGSASESERAVAALKATQLLHSHGLTWAILVASLPVAPAHQFLTQPETRIAAARMRVAS